MKLRNSVSQIFIIFRYDFEQKVVCKSFESPLISSYFTSKKLGFLLLFKLVFNNSSLGFLEVFQTLNKHNFQKNIFCFFVELLDPDQ